MATRSKTVTKRKGYEQIQKSDLGARSSLALSFLKECCGELPGHFNLDDARDWAQELSNDAFALADVFLHEVLRTGDLVEHQGSEGLAILGRMMRPQAPPPVSEKEGN